MGKKAKKKAQINHRVADYSVDQMISKLGSNDNRQTRLFYYKVVYSFSQAKVFGMVEHAVENGKNPPALFFYMANKELEKIA